MLYKSYKVLQNIKPPVTIVKRQYPSIKYTHLDADALTNIDKGTRVYHVTKEFGPAVTSDLGRYVTGLAAAQQASGLTNVAIVMPLYSFMKKIVTRKELTLSFDVHSKRRGQTTTLDFHIFKMTYAFNPPVQAPNKYEWKMIKGVNTSFLVTPQRKPLFTDAVPVYLIGPANKRPFSQAFKSRTADDIHNENPDLPKEWKDQYFAKAVAAFLSHKATAADEESIFAPIRIVPRVDIVHIHGVSNAYTAKFLQDKKDQDDLGPRPPAIVYTMHDHQAELRYANSVRNVLKFLDRPKSDREKLQKYVYGGRMFMSKLAMDHAEAVTMTNHALAVDVVEGKKDFHLKELVMDSLLQKAQGSRFYGINGAIDYYSTDHPFITDKLRNKSMLYPRYALDMIHDQPLLHSTDSSLPFALTIPKNTLTYWTLPELSKDFVSLSKDKAKRLLIKRHILTEADMKRAVVLFRGRFEPGAGLEIVEQAIPHFIKNDMRFILLGTRKGYPLERLENLAAQYPDHVRVISRAIDERRVGVFCRAAADFVFVPNPNPDDLALQAVEGLAFGSAVISSGVGRMKKALIDRPLEKRKVNISFPDPESQTEKGAMVISSEYYNAYIYTDTASSLGNAISDAALDYQQLDHKALREEFILRMIRSALCLAWDKGHYQGPVYEYNQVYELALKDRVIPEMRRHEVEQESELISRLQKIQTN
ncbi:hypothetical protein G6F26_008992 [Rhizopus arrhizus]|nr:hypothetical protein G6F22_004972 [Rhizopus arrhizus]KAG0827727.1 hypothetical protein G6F19_008635 [Rhizopus arrhizus]KAG0851853.1 hypothetical protein G6F17_008631 [Rhizopus arrhizus]KAG0880514.1 hypothetical protein G6F15_008529 [Rhizopus arrhizus]KAG0936502.1 hypothetical protein G6F30_008776 [Rhizopus arrhizus]